jgi:hypothetical protein
MNTISTPSGANRRNTGEYHRLHEYLRDRFADRLVLTFGEMEDLLGFPLPEAALVDGRWWSGTPTDRTPQSDAWTLAHRTVTVNFRARTALFERHEPR